MKPFSDCALMKGDNYRMYTNCKHSITDFLLIISKLYFYTGVYCVHSSKCHFSCGISKMMGPKKQHFWPKIHINPKIVP